MKRGGPWWKPIATFQVFQDFEHMMEALTAEVAEFLTFQGWILAQIQKGIVESQCLYFPSSQVGITYVPTVVEDYAPVAEQSSSYS
jgi:hypothetical protein